ncbi:MAG TPA: glycosyltransferase family 4 protein [Bryobacteraceae bacterium]|nr:glycosyltransferase family 4 protein [Bryobacteraceae bacterium]
MTTLHIDLGQEWRGGQSQALLLLKGLSAAGDVAELIAPAVSPLVQRASAAGLSVHPVRGPAIRIRASIEVARRLRRTKFDIVHCHDAHALTAAWLAGAHEEARLVASRRVSYALAQNRLARMRYQSAHRMVAVSGFVKGRLIESGIPSEKIEVIYDGVEVPPPTSAALRHAARRQFGLDTPDDLCLLGSAGYLVSNKGQDVLIQAMPGILAKYPRSVLLLAGDGPCRSSLERFAAQLGISGAVRFTGALDDLASFYGALDVYMNATIHEGLGTALLSAMAHGVPVVTTASDATPEIVKDGVNGRLVGEREPAAIAAAVLRLLDQWPLSKGLGTEARNTVEQRFSATSMVERTRSLYRSLCLSAAPAALR